MTILNSLSSAFFELNLKKSVIMITFFNKDINHSNINYQYPNEADGAIKIHKRWFESMNLY